MTNKKFLLLSASITAFTAAGLAVVVASGINNSRGQQLAANSNIVNGSVVFKRDSTVASGSFADGEVVLSSSLTQSGIGVLASINGNGIPGNNKTDIARISSESQGVTFSIAENTHSVTNFSCITSVSFTYNTMYNNSSYGEPYGYYKVYFATKSDFSDATVINVAGNDRTSINSNVENAHYFKITGYGSEKYCYFASITINYSCDPSGAPIEPEEPDIPENAVALKYGQYRMSFVEEAIPYLDYEKSSLPTYGIKGQTVTLVVVPLEGYYVYEDEGWYAITDEAGKIGTVTHVSGDTYTFTMPSIFADAYFGIMIGFGAY